MRVLLLVLLATLSWHVSADDSIECIEDACLLLPAPEDIDESFQKISEKSAVESMIFVWDLIPSYLIAEDKVQLTPEQLESNLDINSNLEKLRQLNRLYQLRLALNKKLKQATVSATAAFKDSLERP